MTPIAMLGGVVGAVCIFAAGMILGQRPRRPNYDTEQPAPWREVTRREAAYRRAVHRAELAAIGLAVGGATLVALALGSILLGG